MIIGKYVDRSELDDSGRQSVGRYRDGIVWTAPVGAQSAVSPSRGLTLFADVKCCHQRFFDAVYWLSV